MSKDASPQDEDKRLKVYIAGPYAGGDWGENIQNAVEATERLWDAGYLPFCPHTHNALWSVRYPKEKEEWLDFDTAWVEQCDLLLRLAGDSPGSEVEVEFAENHDIPVYHSIDELLEQEQHAVADGGRPTHEVGQLDDHLDTTGESFASTQTRGKEADCADANTKENV